MDRHCKNCGHNLYVGQNYCSICGAKWIEKRITLKNVAHDFSDMYLGLDNRFLRTFIDLFKQPHFVINGYIKGQRGRYLEAIRYTLLAVFFAGLYVLILKKVDPEFTFFGDYSFYRELGYTDQMIADMKKFNEMYISFVLDYQGLIILISIPLYAFIARLTFWKKSKYFNFTEQMVFFFYVFGQASLISSILSLILIAIDIELFLNWLMLFIPLQIIYTAYCYARCFQLTFKKILLKTFLFLGVLIGLYLVAIILGFLAVILLKISGVV